MILALKGKLILSDGTARRVPAENPAASPWRDVVVGLVSMGYDLRNAETAVIETAEKLAEAATEEAVLRGSIVLLANKR
jgi:Holliday junction resolvasome RuvABC DNA-binding subunit